MSALIRVDVETSQVTSHRTHFHGYVSTTAYRILPHELRKLHP